jgi:hypothetical protein
MDSKPGQIYTLIPKIMAEVGAIEKGRRNQAQNYAFRGIDDVFAAFQKPLAAHGVFYVPEVIEKDVTERVSGSNKTLIYTTLTIAYTFYAPDGSSVRAVVVGEAMDSADKSSNKAMSAALKYALLQIFCVPSDADDADAETHDIQPRQASRPRPVETPKRQPEPAADEPITATTFWQAATRLGIEKPQANAIREKHTKGADTDWAKALKEMQQLEAA